VPSEIFMFEAVLGFCFCYCCSVRLLPVGIFSEVLLHGHQVLQVSVDNITFFCSTPVEFHLSKSVR